MKKRIKELAQQSGMVMYPTGLGINENTIWGDRNIEKFADLIIQECVKFVEETPLGYKDYRSQIEEAMRNDCANAVKRQFESNIELKPIKKDIRYCLDCLKDYSRIKANIESMWGTNQGRKYIFGLIVDDRDRPNSKVSGFPATVIEAINILLELHDEFYPAHKPPVSVWDQKL